MLWNLRMDNTDAHKTKYKEERLYMSTNQNLMQHMRELIDRIKAADVAYYRDDKLWRPLLDKIIFEKETTNMSTNTSNPFYGKTVVATGKLENYTRDGIQMRLLELGAKPGSSVSKNTDYLIVGEKAGSKLAKAQQLGVKTLTEQEFENMLAE